MTRLDGRFGVNHLYRLVAVEVKGGTQGFVSRDQGIEAGLQRPKVKIALQTQGDRNVVRATLGVHLPEKPLPLLGVGQRQRFPGALAGIGATPYKLIP